MPQHGRGPLSLRLRRPRRRAAETFASQPGAVHPGGLAGLEKRGGVGSLFRASCLILAISVLILDGRLALPAAAGQVPTDTIRVAIQEGLLTVDARDAPLADVLRVIGERTGVRVTLFGDVSTRITRSLTAVSLDEGIRQLVKGHSFALVYAPSRSRTDAEVLTEVWVIGSSPVQPGRTRVDAGERMPRLKTVQMLATRRDEAAAAELAQILSQDTDPVVRTQAAAALGRVGGAQAVAALTEALADQAVSVRIQAVRAFQLVKGVGAVPALRGVLTGDPDPRVRLMAARVLAALQSVEGRSALEAATSDPDESVRREVAAALARWKTRAR